MQLLNGEKRGISPVIGVILMVAITVLLAAVAGVFFTGFDEKLSGNTANAKVSFSANPVGLEMVVEVITIEADVRLNGKTIGTIDEGDAGRSMLLPTSPGDRITIVSGDSTQSVLVDKTAESRDEIGDFIAHYRFDQTSGKLKDYAGNGNDATIIGSPHRTGNLYNFDATNNDEAAVSLTSPQTVNEVTILVAFNADAVGAMTHYSDCGNHLGGGCGAPYQQLFEYDGTPNPRLEVQTHKTGPSQFQMYMETPVDSGSPATFDGGTYQTGKTYVSALTYDGSKAKHYMDGTVTMSRVATGTVDIGDFQIADQPSQGENFHGDICEIRLYYHAFDQSKIQRITDSMSC